MLVQSVTKDERLHVGPLRVAGSVLSHAFLTVVCRCHAILDRCCAWSVLGVVQLACVCVCVCARVRVRARVRACVVVRV
jgi:hypothetical protein